LKDGLVRQGVIYGDRHEKKGGTYVGIWKWLGIKSTPAEFLKFLFFPL
jgi:hypothetical protein